MRFSFSFYPPSILCFCIQSRPPPHQPNPRPCLSAVFWSIALHSFYTLVICTRIGCLLAGQPSSTSCSSFTMAALPQSMPLDCSICPKKPTFSDVSHLLTHIGSKGHLSHYYRLKIKANTDPASYALCDTYDRWYVNWGLEGLMSERMSLKDKKKPRSRNAGKLASPSPQFLASSTSTELRNRKDEQRS